MAYRFSTTVTKTASPAAVIIAGSNLIQTIAQAAGIEISGETSYVVITSIYSLFKGLQNYLKNRRKR